MAEYLITAPTGDKFKVTAPDNMPEAEVLSRFQRETGMQQPVPARERSWGEYAGGLTRQALQGASFGFADEAEAGIRSFFGGRPYEDIVGEVRGENREFEQDNPGASLAANLVGGIVPFTGGPLGAAARWAARGSTLPRTMGRSALLGSAAGGVSGIGHGEQETWNPLERVPGGLTGAAFGAGIGAAIPPVFAGAGRGIAWANELMRRGRSTPSADYVPPVRPAGSPIEGARFVNDAPPPPPTQATLGNQQGAMEMINDWITSAGGNIDDIAGFWAAAQRSGKLHSSGEALNAQTLLEIYPPLQRLMRGLASGYREVGENALQFLQARHTGILPKGADAADLARRGIPTRERFLPGRTVRENREQFGVQLGTGDDNISPTGALARVVDEFKRLFRIKDYKFHGHAATASRTSDDILAAMKAESDPAYAKAFAAGDLVPLRPTLQTVLAQWEQTAARSATGIRRVLERGINQFRQGDKQFVNRLRDFDSGKQALDDLIEDHLGKNSGRLLTQMRQELLKAVDDLQKGNPNGVGPLYSEARGIYARGARDREVLEDFRNAWKDDPETVVRRYDALASDDDRKLARYGIVWGMETQNAPRRAAQDATLMLDTNRAEEMLTAIGRRMRASEGDAEEVMRRFGQYIGGEQEMVRGTAKTVIGGSKTDQNVQDALALGTMEIAQNVQSWRNMWRGSTSLWDFGSRIFERIMDRSFGPSADRAREAARLLLTANPQEITAIINQLRMMVPASRMARFNELMRQMQTGGAAAGGVGSSVIGGAVAGQSGPVML